MCRLTVAGFFELVLAAFFLFFRRQQRWPDVNLWNITLGARHKVNERLSAHGVNEQVGRTFMDATLSLRYYQTKQHGVYRLTKMADTIIKDKRYLGSV